MNLFNRIFLIVLSVALIAAAISLITFTWSIPGDSIDELGDAVNWLDRHNDDLEKALLTAVAALIGLLALIVVLIEMRPPAGADVKMTDLKVGDAVLSTGAIGQRVEEAVRQVAHVVQARAAVRSKRKGVKVALDLQVAPEANLATLTDEACEAARDVLLNRVHVALAAPPSARIHYRELRLQRASRARSRGKAATETPTNATTITAETPPPMTEAPPSAETATVEAPPSPAEPVGETETGAAPPIDAEQPAVAPGERDVTAETAAHEEAAAEKMAEDDAEAPAEERRTE